MRELSEEDIEKLHVIGLLSVNKDKNICNAVTVAGYDAIFNDKLRLVGRKMVATIWCDNDRNATR